MLSAPNIWNKLPTHLRTGDLNRDQFAGGLKTHLFARAYSPEAIL